MRLRESRRTSLLIFTLFLSISLGCDLPARFFLQAPLIFRCQDFAGDFRRRIDDQSAEFTLQLAHGAFVLEHAGFARLGEDLLRGRNRFLLLCAPRSRLRSPALRRSFFCASPLPLARIS